MNFLHISRKFVFIFLAFVCWICLGFELSASHFQELGHPHIQTFLPGSYTYVNHYNSIVQSADGFIFVGARNGILCYNGITWKHISLNNDIHLLRHQERLIAWSKNFIGSVSCTTSGDFEYVPGDTLNSGDILNIESHADILYILTSEGLFINGPSGEVEFPAEQQPENIFPSGDGIFILTGTNELYRHSGERLEITAVPGGIEHLSHVLKSGDNTLFIDGINSEVFLGFPGQEMNRVAQPAGFLDEFGFNCASVIFAGHIAYGTQTGGVIVSTEEGEVIRRIGKLEGLYGNDVKKLMVDVSENLWVLHEHSVSRIEFPSAFSYYTSAAGLEGNIKDILRFEGELYAAGSKGLFRLSPQDDSITPSSQEARFARVAGIQEDCNCLVGTVGGLVVGSNGGLLHITGQQKRIILSDPVTALHYDPGLDLLFAGTVNGIRIYKMNGWEEIRDLSLPNISIDAISVSSAGILWLTSMSGPVYRSTKPISEAGGLSYSNFTAPDLQSTEGSYIEPLETGGRLLFSGDGGLFTYEPAKQLFLPDTIFDFTLQTGASRIGEIEETSDNNIWFILNQPGRPRGEIWVAKQAENGEYEINALKYHHLDSKIINCLFAEKENVMWMGTNDGILKYDPVYARPESTAFQTHISGIHVARGEQDQVNPQNLLTRFSSSSNSLRFDFMSTDFTWESDPLFQYRLVGLAEEWSEWAKNSFVEFGGLKPGRYEFLVRSQDVYGSVSEIATFVFRIKAPPFLAWYAFLFYGLLVVLIVYFIQKWFKLQQLKEQYHIEEVVLERTESLIKEKEKSDDLLANILPKTTSDELKLTGKVTSSKFKMCTVLFADIQGFTKIAEEMDADKLIDQLDKFYFQFDSVVGKFNIEKIKTIGDAYMAAGGIPIKNRTNPVEVILAALEMQQHMKELKKTKTDIWDLRIGIHTGSVIAGVVGQKKYSYDIWGDTVNTASRMESSGEAGRVNISATTYKLIKDFFQCEFRGKMPVKYKGDIAMFFVNGLNPAFSEADKVTPNAKFIIQIQLLRILDVEEFVMEKLAKELPEDLFFHNTKHTSHVYTQVELLGRGEKVSEEDLLMLRTAALLHDMGYIDTMDDHETRSVEYAREILPLYHYNEEQIEQVCKLIMATSIPPDPQNILEQILCDANLDHIGRVDFLIQSDKLFQEYRMRHKVKSKKDWNQYQVNLLESHEFYTNIARKMREISKEQQIENIKQFS